MGQPPVRVVALGGQTHDGLHRPDAIEEASDRVLVGREPVGQRCGDRLEPVGDRERFADQRSSELVEVVDGSEAEVVEQSEQLEHVVVEIGVQARVGGLVK